MNTLVQGYYTNDFQLNCRSKPVFSEETHVFASNKLKPGYKEVNLLTNGLSSPLDEHFSSEEYNNNSKQISNESSPVDESSSSSSPSSSSSSEEKDHSDAIFKFITQMLMEEEDLVNKPCMLHDCLALQATEKSLYDVLTDNSSGGSSSDTTGFVESNWSHNNIGDFQSQISCSEVVQYPSLHTLQLDAEQHVSPMDPFRVSNYELFGHNSEPNNEKTGDYTEIVEKYEGSNSPGNSREKKNHYREDSDLTEGQERSQKQLANNVAESEPLDMYDNVLLCSNSGSPIEPKKKPEQSKGGSGRGRPRGGGKKQGIIIVKEVVDLRSLLMQCAQAVASFDGRTVNDLLLRIRQHSSPQGDGMERLAHYFANAFEARLAGTGTPSYAALNSKRISAAEILEAYKTFITACPFQKMSNLLANKMIKKLATRANTLHIIDFGILYGYQWPCLIQALSGRPGGPPKLRITGIDFPQPGFRPAERVAATCQRLAKYCERFGVPFEYNAIAQKWETIKLEDLKIAKNDEYVVVNSLYRLHNVLDETVVDNSPRDGVLSLIKKISPDVFIHGVVNGTYNTPFFVTRFREALFHFSSMFDMFEATIHREDQNRRLFEEHVFGRDVMNVVACEGTERIERPETYKQWQVRNVRAGLKQVKLDREIVEYVRSKVKNDYHKDFAVDEDGKWMLQGWKGRVIHAISCWQPAHTST